MAALTSTEGRNAIGMGGSSGGGARFDIERPASFMDRGSSWWSIKSSNRGGVRERLGLLRLTRLRSRARWGVLRYHRRILDLKSISSYKRSYSNPKTYSADSPFLRFNISITRKSTQGMVAFWKKYHPQLGYYKLPKNRHTYTAPVHTPLPPLRGGDETIRKCSRPLKLPKRSRIFSTSLVGSDMVRGQSYIPVTLKVTPKRFTLLNKESSQAHDMRHKQAIPDGEHPVILVDSRIMPEEVGLSRLSRLLNLADKNEALTTLVGSGARCGSYPTINKSYQIVGTHLMAIATICVQKLVRESYFGLFDFAALFVYKNSDLLSSVNSKLLIQTKMFFNETFFNLNRYKTISRTDASALHTKSKN